MDLEREVISLKQRVDALEAAIGAPSVSANGAPSVAANGAPSAASSGVSGMFSGFTKTLGLSSGGSRRKSRRSKKSRKSRR